ncbi:MAG: two-component regulator propeller domain-containing protein [Planctomycetales bacterium]
MLDQSKGVLSRNLTSVAADSKGTVFVGSRAGVDLVRDGKPVRSLVPKDGLNSTDVRSMGVGPDGRVWVGTSHGVTRYNGKEFSLRHSLRWLPGDEVRGVAFATDGSAWVATNQGLSCIRSQTMTLAEKAAYYLDVVRKRHVREPGLVDHTRLRVPGDVSTWEDMDTDNDGKYTGIYLAMESYRYAVTKAEDAKKNAAQAFRGLEFLQTVTRTPGFVARTVIPIDWKTMADANHTYTDQEVAEERVKDPRFRRMDQRWRPSADGKWRWKGGTSSDETTGHFYAYALYYDLVAEGEEKTRVARLVKRIMDHIIDGGYVFRDIDGEATRWGVWSPEKLNHDPDWSLERGCNSVEIIAYLTITKHVTGEAKYEREIEKLLKEHHYAENMLEPMSPYHDYFTYIGYDLLSMCYPALLTYEKNPERVATYRKSLEAWYAPIKKDNSAQFSYIYAAHAEGEIPNQGCVDLLRDIPLDQIEWAIDNSHREDIKLVHRPAEDGWQTDRLLPPSERAVFRADSNVYRAWNGNGGHEEGSCVAWLLPYWMGRYHGFIEGAK